MTQFVALAGMVSGHRGSAGRGEEHGGKLTAIILSSGVLSDSESDLEVDSGWSSYLTPTQQNPTGFSNFSLLGEGVPFSRSSLPATNTSAEQMETGHRPVQKLSNLSFSAADLSQSRSSEPMTITPTKQNDTGYSLFQRLSTLSLSARSLLWSRSNMPTASSSIGYGPSYHTLPLWLAIAVWVVTVFGILTWSICCNCASFSPSEDSDFAEERHLCFPKCDEQQAEQEDADKQELEPEQHDGAYDKPTQRKGLMKWVQSQMQIHIPVAGFFSDSSAAGDMETSHDRAARIISNDRKKRANRSSLSTLQESM